MTNIKKMLMIKIDLSFIKAFSPNEQLIMLQLLLHADKDGVVEFSDRGVSRLTGIPYQQVRTIHQKWLKDGTIINATANAPINAKHVFVTICDYDSYNVFNTFSNAVNNAVANALNEDSRKEKVSSHTTTIGISKEVEELKKENERLKEELNKLNNQEKEKSKKEKDDYFEECWLAYNRKGSKKKSLEQWAKLTADEKAKVLPHIKAYVSNREKQYQKDFERYLRDRTFESIVVNKDSIVFDPAKNSGEAYMPACDGFLSWNDYYNCYMYIGYWDGRNLADGYTDEKRPNGAQVTLNNGRGTIVWDSSTRKWNQKQTP